MIIVDSFGWSLEEWQKGIFKEVVEDDAYKIKELNFVPDVVFDIGACFGAFSVYARDLWPSTVIIAIEPDEKNFEYLKKVDSIYKIRAALGSGQLYHDPSILNGAHEQYITGNISYPEDFLCMYGMKHSDVEVMSLKQIVNIFGECEGKILIKCDCEGAEWCIFDNYESFDIIKKTDYVAIEVHDYYIDPKLKSKIDELISRRMSQLSETHNVIFDNNNMLARKK